jgi:hypothetical protein
MSQEANVRFWEGVGVRPPALLDYLRAYDSITDARVSLGRYFAFYDTERRPQALDRRTPDSVYSESAARLAARPEEALIALSNFRRSLLYFLFLRTAVLSIIL